MKGFPKKLNSKADYLFIKEHFPEDEWKPIWEKLLKNRKNWFATGIIDGTEGIEDATHRIEKCKDNDGKDILIQMELKDDMASDFYRLHFSEDEVRKAIDVYNTFECS